MRGMAHHGASMVRLLSIVICFSILAPLSAAEPPIDSSYQRAIDPFSAEGWVVLDLIMVPSADPASEPTTLALMASQGKTVREDEYGEMLLVFRSGAQQRKKVLEFGGKGYHSMHLAPENLHDFDGDGRDEIILPYSLQGVEKGARLAVLAFSNDRVEPFFDEPADDFFLRDMNEDGTVELVVVQRIAEPDFLQKPAWRPGLEVVYTLVKDKLVSLPSHFRAFYANRSATLLAGLRAFRCDPTKALPSMQLWGYFVTLVQWYHYALLAGERPLALLEELTSEQQLEVRTCPRDSWALSHIQTIRHTLSPLEPSHESSGIEPQ